MRLIKEKDKENVKRVNSLLGMSIITELTLSFICKTNY